MAARSLLPLLLLALVPAFAPGTADAGKIAKAFFCSALFAKEGKSFRADLSDPVERGSFKISTGTRISIRTGAGDPIEGQLMGVYTSRSRKTTGYLVYHEADDLEYVVPPGKLSLRMNGKPVTDDMIQPIIDPFEQSGETCMANAGDAFLQTTDLNRYDGVGPMDEVFATEEGRIRTYGDIDYEYYQVKRNNNNMGLILNRQIEKMYTASHRKPPFKVVSVGYKEISSGEELITLVQSAIESGSPVLSEFYIGTEMTNSATRTLLAGRSRVEDPRLWLPRARGEKNGGGHGVVLLQHFTTPRGRLKFVVADGDWEHVRVWDAEEYLAKRYRTSKMVVHYLSRK
jgi:hypothetical protein